VILECDGAVGFVYEYPLLVRALVARLVLLLSKGRSSQDVTELLFLFSVGCLVPILPLPWSPQHVHG